MKDEIRIQRIREKLSKSEKIFLDDILQQMDRLRSQVETQQDLKAPIKALAEKAGFIVKHH